MKFRVTWRIQQDKWLPIMKKWSSLTPQQRADVGQGVKMIGRWHDTGGRTGVAVFESTDLLALNRYLARWNPFMDLDVAPVVDDEEAAQLARITLEDHGT
jgi:hypothetical protein